MSPVRIKQTSPRLYCPVCEIFYRDDYLVIVPKEGSIRCIVLKKCIICGETLQWATELAVITLTIDGEEDKMDGEESE